MFNKKRLLALGLALCMIEASGCSMNNDTEPSHSVEIYTWEDTSEASDNTQTEDVVETVAESTEKEKPTKGFLDATEKDSETTEKATDEDSTDDETLTDESTSESETEKVTETDKETETETETETEVETTKPEETTAIDVHGLSAVAQVENYVNVRIGPNTSSTVVGKIYNNCAATILSQVDGEDGIWYYINSGNVSGYIKSEFFVVGDAAEQLRETIGVTFATIINDYTRVRTTPTLDTMDNIVTMYRAGTEVAVVGQEGDFVIIETDAASTGYVHISCVNIVKKFKLAISIEEENAKIAEQQRREEEARAAQEAYEQALAQASIAAAEEESRRQQEAYNASVQESINASIAADQATATVPQAPETPEVEPTPEAVPTTTTAPPTEPPATEPTPAAPPETPAASDVDTALRNAIVNYAVQFEGNPYVHAGRSLITGTDCSGFTHLVYENFNISIGWSPSSQSTQGVQIPYTDVKPGDLLFYSNSVKYLGHVALYIGDGKIIHACNEQYGICIWDMMYREPLFAVRYF